MKRVKRDSGPSPLTLLPDELWQHIFSFLPLRLLLRSVALSCQNWKRLALHPSTVLALDLSSSTHCTRVTDEVLRRLVTAYPNVRSVCLRDCFGLTAAGVACVAQLPLLENLDILNCRLDASGSSLIGQHCTRLSSLCIGASCDSYGLPFDGFAITRPPVESASEPPSIAHFGRLSHLRLRSSVSATAEEMESFLSRSPNPLSLDIHLYDEKTLQGISSLGKCPQLASVTLWRATAGDVYLLGASCPNLRSLRLERAPSVTAHNVLALLQTCPNLTSLDAPHSHLSLLSVAAFLERRVTRLSLKSTLLPDPLPPFAFGESLLALKLSSDARDFSFLSRCPNLQKLRGHLDDAACRHLTAHCRRLRSFQSYCASQVATLHPRTLAAVISSCPSLCKVKLKGQLKLRDAFLNELSKCKALVSLRFNRSNELSSAALQKFAAACPPALLPQRRFGADPLSWTFNGWLGLDISTRTRGILNGVLDARLQESAMVAAAVARK